MPFKQRIQQVDFKGDAMFRYALMSCLFIAGSTHADETQNQPDTTTNEDPQKSSDKPPQDQYILERELDKPDRLLSRDSVPRKINESREDHDGIFSWGPVSVLGPSIREIQYKLTEELSLDLGIAYTVLWQSKTGGPGDETSFGGDLDFFGSWMLIGDNNGGNEGRLVFAAEYRHEIGNLAPESLSGEFGGLSPTADGFGELTATMKALYWRQEFRDESLVLSLGKIDAGDFYNGNRLADANTKFTHTFFATNPTRAFPGNGIGLNLAVIPSESWYVSAGVHDANGSKTTGDFRDLDEGEFSYITELGFTPMIDGWGEGQYRFTVWHTDERQRAGVPDDTGFAFSFDQEIESIADDFVVFGRYGYADGDIRGINHLVSGGFGIEGISDRDDDFFGVAIGWGSPEPRSAQEELVLETIYRLQLTSTEQLSLGYQVIIDPAFAPDDDVVGVLQARWRVAY
jgi:porin